MVWTLVGVLASRAAGLPFERVLGSDALTCPRLFFQQNMAEARQVIEYLKFSTIRHYRYFDLRIFASFHAFNFNKVAKTYIGARTRETT